jgi:hypothetical protein
LQVVFKAAMVLHAGIQGVLPGVSKGRVAQIMRQRYRLGQFLVQAQQSRNRAADLRHFQAVRQTRAEMVALVVHEHLGLVFQAAESGGVHDAIAVALEFASRMSGRLGMHAAPRLRVVRSVGSKFRPRGHNA